LLGDAELVENTTTGDRVRAAGDKSRFTKEIEDALLAGEVDVAVHSAKDVPGELPEGLEIVAAPERADPRDVLIGATELKPGMRIGTASIRRRSQLLALEPELEVVELRGNVDTRLRKLQEEDYDAIVLAKAGLDRLGRSQGTPLDSLTPAPGQGCLALEIRADDAESRAAVERINDPVAFACLAAERECVIALEATCDTPIGVFAESIGGGRLRIRAYAGTADGSLWIRDELEAGADAGRLIADRLLAAGAAEILAG
jgi:hydroxymethylbilane synthase